MPRELRRCPMMAQKKIVVFGLHQLFGSIFGSKSVPKENAETRCREKLLLAWKMNRTAKCLLNLSSAEKVSQMAIYNGRTTDLRYVDAAKVGTNLFKPFHSKHVSK
jgi:hypothetical protein